MNINHTNSTNNSTSKLPTRNWDHWEIILLILLIIGCIGNTLTIIVMQSKRMRNTNAALFLTLMAFADICTLVIKFLANMQKMYRLPVYNYCILAYVIPDMTIYTSYWLVMMTTAERSVAVRCPLKVSDIFSRFRCIVSLCSIISFFSILSSSQAICLEYYPERPYYCKIKGNSNGTCFFYLKTVYPWIKSAFMSWLPSILGIILNTIILKSLYTASKKRKIITNSIRKENVSITPLPLQNQSSTSVESLRKCNINPNINKTCAKERHVTIMLFTISVTFVAFTLPFATYELLRKLGFKNKFFINRNAQRAFMFPIDCLHTINFFLYCLSGKKFRDTLFDMFCSSVNNKRRKRELTYTRVRGASIITTVK